MATKGTNTNQTARRKSQVQTKKTKVVETPDKWKRKKRRQRQKAIGIILAILLIIGSIFEFVEYQKEASYRSVGIEYFKKEEYKKAQKQLNKALEYTNIFGRTLTQDIRYYLAESYFLEGEYEKALTVYQEISRKEKDKEFVACYLGATYAKLGDSEKAKEMFEQSISLGNEEGYHYLSKMYYDLGEYEKAVENEKQFMKLREPDGTSYMLLAKSYCADKKFKQAIQAIEEGIALDDSEKQALLFEEIVIYEKKLDFDTAYEKCLAYVSAYPDDKIAKEELEFLETR